jgi:hypothetical protein
MMQYVFVASYHPSASLSAEVGLDMVRLMLFEWEMQWCKSESS